MWVKRFPYEALVSCKSGLQTTWLLKCAKGVWEGQVGICSSSAASAPVLAQPKTKGSGTYNLYLHALFTGRKLATIIITF